MDMLQIFSIFAGMKRVFLSTTLLIVSSVSVLLSSLSHFCFRKMVVLLRKRFDSLLYFKKHCIQISATVFLLSTLFASGSLAKEETRYIKGLGAVLREQPSIRSKTLTKLSVVLKCLSWRQKVSGIKLKQKKIRVGFYEVRLQIFHLKSKK